jgi:hypothetical protein
MFTDREAHDHLTSSVGAAYLESRCSIHLPEHVAPTELVIQVGWDVYKYSAPLELARLVVAFAAQRNPV